MFSFGVDVLIDGDHFVISDSVNGIDVSLFYDELFELGIILKAVSSDTLKNVDTKLSTTLNVTVSKTKSQVHLIVGALDLTLTIGQFKALENYINRLLSLYCLIRYNATPTNVENSGVSLNDNFTVKSVSESNTNVVKNVSENKEETVANKDNNNDEVKKENQATGSIKDALETVSAILALDKSKLTDKVLTELSEMLNKLIGENYNLSATALEVIIDGAKKIVKESDITIEAYLRQDYNEQYPILAKIWQKMLDSQVEQDKRLHLAAYYIITNYIEVNQMLTSFA